MGGGPAEGPARAGACALLCLLVSCHPAARIDERAIEGAQLLIWIAVAPDGEKRAAVYDAEGPQHPLAFDDGTDLYVLGYDRPPAYLQLPFGPLDLSGEGNTRRLPLPDKLWHDQLDAAGTFEAGVPEDAAPVLADVLLPAIDFALCAAADGCRDADVCKIPCEPPDPLPPAAPRFDWPSDWVRRDDLSTSELEVFAPVVPAPASCGASEAQWYGDPGCSPVGSTCAGRWHPSVASRVDPGVLFVADTAPDDSGSGSSSQPLRTLAAAFLRATRGSTIALSTGEHLAARIAAGDVTILGACAAGTLVRGTTAHALGVDAGVDLRVRDVTLEGTSIGAAHNEGRLELTDVITRGRVYATAGRVVVQRSKLSATVNTAIMAITGAHLYLRDVFVEGGSVGSVLLDGGTGELERVVLRGGVAGLQVFAGGGARLSKGVIDGLVPGQLPPAYGLLVGHIFAPDTVVTQALCRAQATSTATLSDVVIRGLPGVDTRAMQAHCGGRIDLERAFVEGVHGHALSAGLAARFEVRDTVFSFGEPRERHLDTEIQTDDGAIGTLERVVIDAGSNIPLELTGTGSSYALSDLAVFATSRADHPMQLRAAGIRLERVLFRGGQQTEIHTHATVDVKDFRIAGSERGLSVYFEGASGRDTGILDRVAIQASGDIGFELGGCDAGQSLVIERCTAMSISDLVIQGGLTGFRAGVGTIVPEGTTIDRFLFEGNENAAVHLPAPQPIELKNGRIRDTDISFLLEHGGHDLTRLIQFVRLENAGPIDDR